MLIVAGVRTYLGAVASGDRLLASKLDAPLRVASESMAAYSIRWWTVHVLAQGASCAPRQHGELGKRRGRLRRVIKVAPTDAWEPGLVGNDRGAQFAQHVVKSERRSGPRRERLNNIKPLQETLGPFDPAEILNHFSSRSCQWSHLRGAAEAWRWRHPPPGCCRPRCRRGRAWHRR